MTRFHIDPVNNKTIASHEAHAKSCVADFCSWRRLTEVFAAAKEFRDTETIVAFDVGEDGLVIRIAHK